MTNHVRRRPITGTTAAGVSAPTIIVLDPWMDDITVQVIANGTVTFALESTIQNVLYDAAAIAAVNVGGGGNPNDRYVDPASAVWSVEVASASISFKHSVAADNLLFALRIDQTAGTGSVTYTINQG